MTDFSDLLNDDFNITESLFDDLIQDLQTDTTNYQNLNQEGLNFPDLLGGDGLLNAFDDDVAVLDMLSNYTTDDLLAASSGNQEFKSNYYYPKQQTAVGNLSTNPQLQKQHILSTGTPFMTEIPPVHIPTQQSPSSGMAFSPTNLPYTDSDMMRDMHVVKSSSAKSHKKQKTFFETSAANPSSASASSAATFPRTAEYFLGDIPPPTTSTPTSLPATNSSPPNTTTTATAFPALRVYKHPLTQLPITIFQAFNAGDISKVKEILSTNTLTTCALRTPSLDSDMIGQQYVHNFFQAIYDAHPDAVFVTKKCKYNPVSHSIESRIYFAGTRMMKSSLMISELQGTNDWLAPYGNSVVGSQNSHSHNSHSSHSSYNSHSSGSTFFLNYEYLYKKKGASLLDEMDVSMLSHPEIAAMKELENSGKNLSVFFKGSLLMFLNMEGNAIQKLVFDWKITSFREANL